MLHYGLIGGGMISHSHITGASHKGLSKLSCGCFSRDSEKNLAYGSQYGLDPSRVYPDYQAMAAQEAVREDKPDFVIVCTPHPSHYEICKAFLNAGFPVVCDKPLSIYADQAQELAELAREKDLLCCVTFSIAASPYLSLMRTLHLEGLIGNVYYASLSYTLGRRFKAVMNNEYVWRFSAGGAGPAGALADLCSHLECIARFVLDSDIERVLARLLSKPGGLELDGSGCVLFDTFSGVSGQFYYNQVACGGEDITVKLYGDAGSMSWCYSAHDSLVIDYPDGRCETIRDPGVDFRDIRRLDSLGPMLLNKHTANFATMYSDFVGALLAKAGGHGFTAGFHTFEDGAKSVRFTESALKSNGAGNIWVSL
jgi:predicted dehydrogenase